MTPEVERYLRTADSAAGATRRPLAVIVTISVLAAFALWNTRQRNWYASFLRASTEAAEYLEENHFKATQGLGETSQRSWHRAKKFLAVYPFASPVALRQFARKVDDHQFDNLLFMKVPVFGVSCHVNDVGVLCGFAFFVSVLWYRQALLRHRLALGLLISKAEAAGVLAEVVDHVAVHQFMVTPLPASTREGVGRYLQALLLALPVLLLARFLYIDWSTRVFGEALDEAYVNQILSLEVVLLSVLIVATASSIRILLNMASTIERNVGNP